MWYVVASFTDAWIETIWKESFVKTHVVASFTDAWIETESGLGDYIGIPVASFTDAWIETETWSRTANLDASHLLQMRGLKP